MNKFFSFLMIFLFSAVLFAENDHTESGTPAKKDNLGDQFYAQIEIGFGGDFTGTPGRLPDVEDFVDFDDGTKGLSWMANGLIKNQFGVTAGIDFSWRLFRKTSGEGAGELYLGFGFDFQYWAPTAVVSDDNFKQNPKERHGTYIALHYMRVPAMLNVSYDFKVNAGTLHRVGPKFSAGINNNLFILKYDYDKENKDTETALKKLDDNIEFHQMSFAWSLGLNLVFSNRCFIAASIGGDKGSEHFKHYFFKENSGKILFNHHEFIIFETGYRF